MRNSNGAVSNSIDFTTNPWSSGGGGFNAHEVKVTLTNSVGTSATVTGGR